MNELDMIDEHGYRDTALAQLAAVRETGAVNMHNMDGVRRTAETIGFESLVDLLDDLAEERESVRSRAYLKYLNEMAEREADS